MDTPPRLRLACMQWGLLLLLLLVIGLAAPSVATTVVDWEPALTSTNSSERAITGNVWYYYKRPKPVSHTVSNWYQDTYGIDPWNCTVPYSGTHSYIMLRAYRLGSVQNVHWIYTDNRNDTRCLENWYIYSADGSTIKHKIKGRTTTLEDQDNKRWCALPVYRAGGVVGKQIAVCQTRWPDGTYAPTRARRV